MLAWFGDVQVMALLSADHGGGILLEGVVWGAVLRPRARRALVRWLLLGGS